MRRLRLTLDVPEGLQHPMQRFLARDETADRHRLLYGNTFGGATLHLLFHVEDGDPERHARALDAIEAVHSYDIAPVDERAFYVLVEEEWPPIAGYFEHVLRTTGVIPIPPIDVTGDGSVRVTLVGDHEELRTLVRELPEALGVDVEQLDAYERPVSFAHGSLTARQREAVEAATEVGYYDVPRDGGVEDVAEMIGCAPSTASNHLRKAEAAVMTQVR